MARAAIKIRPHNSHDHGECDHCGGTTRTVWGYASKGGKAWAVYYVQFTFGHPERGAQMLVSVGGWGKDEDEAGRVALAALCTEVKGRPQFTPLDASSVNWGEKELNLGEKLGADAARSSEHHEEAQRLMRQIVFDDERVRLFVTRDGRDSREAKDWVERAHARLQMGDDAEAVACAALAIGHDPDQHEAYFVRGWARGRDGDLAGGVADLRTFLERAPRSSKSARAKKILAVYEKKLARATKG
jgi:hypothetical protein